MHPLQAKLADIAYKTIAATCAGVTVYGVCFRQQQMQLS